MVVSFRVAVSVGTWEMGTALSTGTDEATSRSFAAPRSTTVPQAWHSPQRPTQRTEVQPHSEQG